MPGIGSLHVDKILTNVSIQYKNDGFIADKVFPVVPVKKESDKYFVYDKRDRFQIPKTLRAPRANSKRIDWGKTSDNYSCDEHMLEDMIDDREKANADKPLNLRIDSTEIVTDQLMLANEKRVADIVTNVANIPQNVTLSGANQWNDPNSDPINDIKTARITINQATGKIPNTLVIPMEVYENLKQHEALMDRIKFSQLGVMTVDLLKSLFDVANIYIGFSIYDSSNEGQTENLTRVWGKDCLLSYSEPRPGIKRVSLGYTFQARPFRVQSYREERATSDIIRVSNVQDEKLVAADVAYLIKNAVA